MADGGIQVDGLVKIYPRVRAVDGITFSVNHGEIFGFLGPNGAGKTTTVRILLTLIKPNAGSIRVFGEDALAHPERVRQMSGYVPQDVSVDGDLTGYENILLYSRLYYLPPKIRETRIQKALEALELKGREKEMVSTYSGGMMRRLEIAQALVNHPLVLFLDEPSIGLDPGAKRTMWGMIKQLRDDFGTTIFVNTHDMNEADTLCDRLGIMVKGKLIVTGAPATLKSEVGGDILTITSRSADCAIQLQALGYQVIAQASSDSYALLVSAGERVIPSLLESLQRVGIEVEAVSLKKPSLDDVFLKYTGSRLDEGETWKETRRSRRSFKKLNG